MQALSSRPVRHDIDIEIGRPYIYNVKDEPDECAKLIRRELKLFNVAAKKMTVNAPYPQALRTHGLFH
jgi:hypothetical protein